MSAVYAVTVASVAVAFGPVMLMSAVLWWPFGNEGSRRRSR